MLGFVIPKFVPLRKNRITNKEFAQSNLFYSVAVSVQFEDALFFVQLRDFAHRFCKFH